MAPDERIIINVGGVQHETLVSTLKTIPGTRLSRLTRSDPSYDHTRCEYFFDRNPTLFASILDLYRLNELHFPHCTCASVLQRELAFWDIDWDKMSDCCQRRLRLADEQAYKSAHVEKILADPGGSYPASWYGGDGMDKSISTTQVSCRMQVWQFLEDPASSLAAKIWGLVFLILVLISVIIQCGITSPVFRQPIDPPRRPNASLESNPKMRMYLTSEVLPPLYILDTVCLLVFVLELVLRFVLCPSKCQFFWSLFNWIDILSTGVSLFGMIYELVHPDFWSDTYQFSVMYILSAFSVFRTLRLIKFARQYHGVRLLLLALRSSIREIGLLIMIFIIGMLIFSNMIYYAEFYSSENDFYSIPIGFWWAIVTMTTVGYGDKHPHSAVGYVVGGFCAITGMLCAALPIPIIANNFNLIYSYDRRRRLAQKQAQLAREAKTFVTIDTASSVVMDTTATDKPVDIIQEAATPRKVRGQDQDDLQNGVSSNN